MTLTPQRDTLNRVFSRARDESARLPAGDAIETIGREASHAAVEAVMGAMADMMDLGADAERAQAHFENILANTIVSHSLSLAGSDRTMAAGFAVETLERLGLRCRAYLQRERGDVDVAERVASAPAGNA